MSSDQSASPDTVALDDHHQEPLKRSPSGDADLKARRQERRERLYSVVREAMLRSEVLASRFKFKVLSLDTHGRQFLIMIDLMDASAVSPDRFSVIEQLIIAHAAQQHGIYVKSVYWRGNEAPIDAGATPVPAPAAASVATPVAPPTSVALTPVATAKQPEKPFVPVPTTPHIPETIHKPAFDPIDQAEVLAFKKAIGAIPSAPSVKAPGKVQTSGPRHKMTGFEDTQILATPEEGVSPLSVTQFGELL
jgi:hypothetical protein